MGKLQVVVGGQFGSEGKGAIAAFLAREHADKLLAVRVAGPNAGHTVLGNCPPGCTQNDSPSACGATRSAHKRDCHPWRLRQLPVAAVSNPDAQLLIAAGSEIDPGVLEAEVEALDAAGYRISGGRRLMIDSSATVIERHHGQIEGGRIGSIDNLVDRIGSTGKGVGAARADRAMRSARLAATLTGPLSSFVVRSETLAQQRLADSAWSVLVEGTQGYGLGQHSGNYPHVTSSDCRAIDMLSMAGVSPWVVSQDRLEIWVVYRTFPIRVAGNSGRLDGETTWEELGLPPEHTTVTNKVRRVGQWDQWSASRALRANGLPWPEPGMSASTPVRVALTMCDYLVPGARDVSSLAKLDAKSAKQLEWLMASTAQDLGCHASLAGTGPQTVIDLRDTEIRDARSK